MLKTLSLIFIIISLNACAQSGPKKKISELASVVDEKIDVDWIEKVVKSDEDWKKSLTPKQYYILREEGTERPYSSELYEVHDDGTYLCAGCKNPLFASNAKFNSGTGWPSFFQPFGLKSVNKHGDNSHGMLRDAISCQRCDGHLGHVFSDGPNPTGLRYCIDGDALLFVPLKSSTNEAVATFSGGCFWCTETIFESIFGVNEVISGYSGGKEPNPTYEAVGAGKTGHAEAFEVHYDSKKVSYKDLVNVFFASIDPTRVNGQGPDNGKQYRTIAFYNTEDEKKIIEEKIVEISKSYQKPIATEVSKFEKFWKAEDYHQNFVKLNPDHPYVKGESLPRKARTLAKVGQLIKK
jgi:peptide methionine sulfoxide reductase msrA/msrB